MIFKEADAAGLEPDARLTAIWLWTLGAKGQDNGQKDEGQKDEEEEEGEEEIREGTGGRVTPGYVLEYDAARKIAQGLGAHLERLTTVVEIKGDKARLLPVAERAEHLFGKATLAAPKRRKKKRSQMSLFETLEAVQEDQGGHDVKTVSEIGATVLDRVHQAMILFAGGRSEALKRFLVEDGAGTDARFWKLAQSLSALYPGGSDEKRWIDGVLARKKSLGF
jgi:hypothetical protein